VMAGSGEFHEQAYELLSSARLRRHLIWSVSQRSCGTVMVGRCGVRAVCCAAPG
jgi:hypothetical protein